jgi:hypothetical protein
VKGVICDKNGIKTKLQLPVYVYFAPVKEVVYFGDDQRSYKDVSNQLTVSEEGGLDRVAEGVDEEAEGKVVARGGETNTGTDVERRNVEEASLPSVSWGDKGRMRGVSSERGNGGEDGWLGEERSVVRVVDQRRCFSFSNRSPLGAF